MARLFSTQVTALTTSIISASTTVSNERCTLKISWSLRCKQYWQWLWPLRLEFHFTSPVFIVTESLTVQQLVIKLPLTYLLTYLDLVPPVPVGTLGSSLTPERTIHRSVFNLFPCNVGSRQVFLECSAPTSSSSPLAGVIKADTGILVHNFERYWPSFEMLSPAKWQKSVLKISTTDPAEFHPDRSAFARMAAEKPVLTRNKGRSCLWMGHGRR